MQLVGAAVQGAGALLGGAQRQPRLGLGGAGLPRRVDELLAGVELGLGGRVGLGAGQAALELGEPGLVLLAGGLGLLDRLGQPVGLAPGASGPGSRTGPAPRRRRRAWRRTRAAWRARRRPAGCASARSCSSRAMSKDSRSDDAIASASWRLASSTAAWISSRLGWLDEPPAATWAPRTSPSRVTAVSSGCRATSWRAAVRSPTTATRSSRWVSAGRTTSGHSTASTAYDASAGSVGQVAGPPAAGAAGDDQPGAAEVVGLEVVDRVDGRGGTLDDDRVGGRAQRAGDRGLVATADGEQGGHRAEQPGDVVGGGEQRAGAVLAGEAELEGVLAGGQRGAVAVGAQRLVADLGQPVLEVAEDRGRRLVLGVEALLAGVQPGDAGLEGGEVVLGAAGPGEGLLAGLLEAADLVGGGGRARPGGVDLAVQPGEALAAVGGGTLEAGDPALLLGRGVLGLVPRGDGLVERRRGGRPTSSTIRSSWLAQLGGLDLELLGVAARRGRRLDGRLGVADPLDGQRLGAADPLLDARRARTRSPGPWPARAGPRAAPPRGAASLSRAAWLWASTSCWRATSSVSSASSWSSAVRAVTRSSAMIRARASRTRRLDAGGAAGDLGLAAQRLELAPDLAEQVVEAGQVAVAGVELAERLLLALAVLEDAGGLLDEAAPVLGGGVQDRVELALADDDVHLAADAGVGEQLLDVEQPAGRAVDGVLGAAAAEHGPADGDLGVLDRQRAVGVVDGEDDLGPTQRRAAGGAGEDDVLHLAAAQRLRALLAHHPGERVDDVGLARAVRARRCR